LIAKADADSSWMNYYLNYSYLMLLYDQNTFYFNANEMLNDSDDLLINYYFRFFIKGVEISYRRI